MPWSERLTLAIRQTLDRGRGLSGFLSRLSMLGLVLAVAILFAVLSVMNGFEREMRERILSLVPHVSVRGFANWDDWQDQQARLQALPGVVAITPFFERDVLLVRGARVHAARLLGIPSASQSNWSSMVEPAPTGALAGDEIYLGQALARKLALSAGDRARLILPSGSGANDRGSPRPVTVLVAGLIATGTELDEGLMVGDFDGVAELAGEPLTATGLALQLRDLFDAPALRWQLASSLPPNFYSVDWSGSHGNLYAAIRLSRDLVSLLLLSIIAVAAFNVVSSLVLVVTDRRGAIAMLRAMGATRADIVSVFLLQGSIIGVAGASFGIGVGWFLAASAPSLAEGLEWLLGVQLLNTDVYPLAFLPVDLRPADAVMVWVAAVVLCLLAAVFPASRAARLPIAAVLSSQAS